MFAQTQRCTGNSWKLTNTNVTQTSIDQLFWRVNTWNTSLSASHSNPWWDGQLCLFVLNQRSFPSNWNPVAALTNRSVGVLFDSMSMFFGSQSSECIPLCRPELLYPCSLNWTNRHQTRSEMLCITQVASRKGFLWDSNHSVTCEGRGCSFFLWDAPRGVCVCVCLKIVCFLLK